VTVILGIDHVQLAIPPGGEDQTRDFYVGVLGMTELAKPDEMAKRGGAWFACGAHQLHVGVETKFVPAKKAHPALLVADDDAVRALADALVARGLEVRWATDGGTALRFHVDDPFGNRIEITAPARASG
jgi:catechol 2,3-dioxygenase-like lactoylglutathione lyase family enzyme